MLFSAKKKKLAKRLKSLVFQFGRYTKELNMNWNYGKVILGIIGTILLGAIGSGLWERIISPLADEIMKLSINSINFFFTSYKDSIYKEASNGFHELYSLEIYLILLAILPFLYIKLLQKHPSNKKMNSSEKSTFQVFLLSRNGYFIYYGVTLSVIIFITFSVLRHNYINKTVTYSIKSMEIIKPYISNKKYLLLRSQYFLISNTIEFKEFNKKINDLAKENKLKLHIFKPL